MSARDLISGEAELGSEEEDESFDEETGEVRRKSNGIGGANGHLDDSSEEEDDDDDEEAAAAVRLPPRCQQRQAALALTTSCLLDPKRFHCRGR